jgi:hypothetical protein
MFRPDLEPYLHLVGTGCGDELAGGFSARERRGDALERSSFALGEPTWTC